MSLGKSAEGIRPAQNTSAYYFASVCEYVYVDAYMYIMQVHVYNQVNVSLCI